MAVRRVTWGEVRAWRLARHGLTVPFGTSVAGVSAALAGVGAALAGVHAQVATAAEVALGLRLEGVTRRDIRAAVWPAAGASLVRTFGPRGTVHLLPVADLGMWRTVLSAFSAPPAKPDALLSPGQISEVLAAIGATLGDAPPDGLTVDELGAGVVERAGPWAGDPVMPAFQGMWPRWRMVQHLAGMRGLLCFGPGRGRKVTCVRPPSCEPADRAEASAWIVRAYLGAYGPSTPERFANWLSMPVALATEMFGAADLEPVEVDGVPAWVRAGEVFDGAASARGIRLLPYFDSYAYRVGILAPELLYPGAAASRIYPWAFQNLVVDGVVAGLWQQRRSAARMAFTVEPLAELSAAQRERGVRHRDLRAARLKMPLRRYGRVSRGLRRCGRAADAGAGPAGFLAAAGAREQ